MCFALLFVTRLKSGTTNNCQGHLKTMFEVVAYPPLSSEKIIKHVDTIVCKHWEDRAVDVGQ